MTFKVTQCPTLKAYSLPPNPDRWPPLMCALGDPKDPSCPQTFRPAALLLERSVDHGHSWHVFTSAPQLLRPLSWDPSWPWPQSPVTSSVTNVTQTSDTTEGEGQAQRKEGGALA